MNKNAHPMPRKKGSKQLILDYLSANIGRMIEAKTFQVGPLSGSIVSVSCATNKAIKFCPINDQADMKPGQYLIETAKRRPAFQRGIAKETRAFVYERNGYTCQMCGVAAGDEDSFHPGRTMIRLTLGHIVDKSKGGEDTPFKSQSRLRQLQ